MSQPRIYFYLSDTGTVQSAAPGENSQADTFRQRTGNYYPHQDAAEQALAYVLLPPTLTQLLVDFERHRARLSYAEPAYMDSLLVELRQRHLPLLPREQADNLVRLFEVIDPKLTQAYLRQLVDNLTEDELRQHYCYRRLFRSFLLGSPPVAPQLVS